VGQLHQVLEATAIRVFDKLRGECDNHVAVCSQTRVVAPNAYEVEIDSSLYKELARQARQALMDSLARHGESRGYAWAGPLTVRVTAAAQHL
jgi:FHA domain-containing protein